ncbi:hypothetical protein BDA96_08G172000 [Sorghum bicolor]|uniref:Uncharacterized protein n=1 Tax=Sorghum bicolor TaxID=4558 RepID=A0A921U7F0_SORBI|nr:hypothetical protein BDA96_08G172000 [Sorghum bicolor]
MSGEGEGRRRGSGPGRPDGMRGEGEERRRGSGRRRAGRSRGEQPNRAEGMTPLMFASHHVGNEAIVKYLISNQADPNKADNSGITPLHIAARQGCYEIAEYLLSKGANVDPLCQDGQSPLLCAALQGNERIVTLLLKHNADYNRMSKKMITPLLASLHCSSLSCLEILIEAGADVNGTGCSIPPLALAAYKGLHRCIQCLLRNGANPNLPDEDNNIPIQFAAFKGWERCVEILLPHAPHLAQYEGLTTSEIVQWEKTDRFVRSSRAIEQGDAAYRRKEYDIALRFYTEAAQVGHQDPTLYAKRSLCHLYLRVPAKYTEEAINYMNMVQPNLSTLDPESDAKRMVLDFGRTWKESGFASTPGSGSSPTDKTTSEEHQ